MGFPKIKDRLFSQSKNRVFFMAKTTQNELIAKPSSLSTHRKLNSVVHVCVCTCESVSVSNTHLVYVLEIARLKTKWFDV